MLKGEVTPKSNTLVFRGTPKFSAQIHVKGSGFMTFSSLHL